MSHTRMLESDVAAPPPDRVVVEPQLARWRLMRRSETCDADRAELIRRINRRADRLGLAKLRCDRPIVATGHQAGLWHPGILAKDLAMVTACERLDAQPLHLLVDQDAHASGAVLLPAIDREHGGVTATTLKLWEDHEAARDVPTGAIPPRSAEVCQQAAAKLETAGLPTAADAWREVASLDCASLAEQWLVVTMRVLEPACGAVPMMLASDLEGWRPYEQLLESLRLDAPQAVRCYNQAVLSDAGRQAGLTLLAATREMVELPLWAVRQGEPRQRVWADIADSEPLFVFEDGAPIDRAAWRLLPRALMLTAAMRGAACELFIHGLGGGVYDQAMQQWIATWLGGRWPLAPLAMVTADVRLRRDDIPTATPAELTRAIWYAHHLRHNVDRYAPLDDPTSQALAQEKSQLLAHMDDDRDRRRRRTAFDRLHEINQALVARCRPQVDAADDAVRQAQRGVANAATLRRRDWSFLAYPPLQIAGLHLAIQT